MAYARMRPLIREDVFRAYAIRPYIGYCGIHINLTMKKTTENKPNIRLLPEETIELLKATLEEPPVSRIEELLYCAYIDEDLRQISPGQIVWEENLEDEGEKKDKVYMPCVISVDGNRHTARLEKERESGRPLSLRVL